MGLTQIQLAEQVGVSRDWIIRLEQGRSKIELGLVLRALKTLKLSIQADPANSPDSEVEGISMDDILEGARE